MSDLIYVSITYRTRISEVRTRHMSSYSGVLYTLYTHISLGFKTDCSGCRRTY